jgi:hypothetical protein
MKGNKDIWHGNHKYTTEDALNQGLIDRVVSSIENPLDIFSLPGIVTIPSCTWEEVRRNWTKGITKDNEGTFPCNGN